MAAANKIYNNEWGFDHKLVHFSSSSIERTCTLNREFYNLQLSLLDQLSRMSLKDVMAKVQWSALAPWKIKPAKLKVA